MAQAAASTRVGAEVGDAGAALSGLAARPDDGIQSASTDAARYTAAVYGAQGLLFVAGLVQKGLLGPLGAGYWALMQSFWGYFNIATLGVSAGTTRQIPLHRGRGDISAAVAVSNSGYSFSLVAMALAGVLAAAVALAFGGGWSPEIRFGVILLGLTAPLRFLADCHETILTATKRFGPVSAGTLLKAAITLVLQSVFVVLFGYYGMFLGVAAAAVGVLWLWSRMGLTGWRRPAFAWGLDRARVSELLAYGFPIMVFAQLWIVLMGIDNLIVAGFLGVEALGYYALAVSVTGYILQMPRSIGAVLAPRMSEQFGRTADIRTLSHYATDVQRLLAHLLVPLFVAGAFFLLPVLIRQLLPEFTPAIPIIHIMVAASFFISLCNMPIKVLITAGRRLALIALVVVCLVVNASANYAAVGPLDWGLEGAAFATAFSYLFTFLLTTTFALTKTMDARRTIAHVAELLLAFVYLAAALWAVEWLLGPGAESLVGDALLGLSKLCLVVALMAPWIALTERRYRAVTRLRSKLAGAIRRQR